MLADFINSLLAILLLEGRIRSILLDMKRWYLLLIPILLGLATVAYLVVKLLAPTIFPDILNRDSQAKNRQSDIGKLPAAEAAPREVQALRKNHGLRQLTTAEDGTKIQDLPNGTYGFSMCDVVSLSAKRGTTFSLEIHKHHDGIVYYVGYASDDHIEKYLTRQKNFHILTSPHQLEKSPSLFEIPIEFVSKCEERPSKEGTHFDLFVTTIPELQS